MGVQGSQPQGLMPIRIKSHQSIQDPVFGPVEIFRSQQPPYDYIMKYKRMFSTKDQAYQQFINQLRRFEMLQHTLISKIHCIHQEEELYACTKSPTVSCYVTYYNFTLRKAILRKMSILGKFSEADLWFLVSTLVQLASCLKKQGISIGEYTIDRIYLAPNGTLRLFLLNILPDNLHNPYYQILSDPALLGKYLVSPQQLSELNREQYQIKFDVYKSDMFIIGLIILQMASLKSSSSYYDYEKRSLNTDKIKQDLFTLKSKYSIQFLNLLSRILESNPEARPNFDSVLQYINKIAETMNVVKQSTGIKLNEEQTTVQMRNKAIQNRRRQLEIEEKQLLYSQKKILKSSNHLSPDFQVTRAASVKKSLPRQHGDLNQKIRAFSIKTRDIIPLTRNPQKPSVFTSQKLSFFDNPNKVIKKRLR